MTYCIVKIMENKNGGKPINCIIIDDQCEVMEFENEDKAESFRLILETNSDSGHTYILKKIGKVG